MTTFITEFQKMYWLRSVGQWISQLSTDNQTVVNMNEEKNLQGIRINVKQKRCRKKKKKKKSALKAEKRAAAHIGQNSLFVCGLSTRSNEIELQTEFEKFGKIKKVKLMRDLKSGKSRRYAFIQYDDHESCNRAYQHSRKTDVLMDGVKVLVDHTKCSSNQ